MRKLRDWHICFHAPLCPFESLYILVIIMTLKQPVFLLSVGKSRLGSRRGLLLRLHLFNSHTCSVTIYISAPLLFLQLRKYKMGKFTWLQQRWNAEFTYFPFFTWLWLLSCLFMSSLPFSACLFLSPLLPKTAVPLFMFSSAQSPL